MSHTNPHQALPVQHQRTMLQQQRGSQSVNSPKLPYQQLQQTAQSAPMNQYGVQHPGAAFLQNNKAVAPDMTQDCGAKQMASPVQNGNYHSMTGPMGVDVSQMAPPQPSLPMPQLYQILQAQQQQLQQQQQQQQNSMNNQQPQQQNQQRGQHRYLKQQQQQQPKQILQHNKTPQPVVVNGQQEENKNASSSTDTTQKSADKENNGDASITSENKETTSNASEKPNLANNKEKTPMCLINELARFNKMHHQYTLVDEQGPAHKKTFYVKLKLGEEEYSASGESIKKAQHAGAAIALTATSYPHPPAKPRSLYPDTGGEPTTDKTDGTITPTVELNALAMRRGEPAVYKSIEPQAPPFYPQANMDFRGLYNQRYHQYMRGGRDPRCRGGGVLWPLRYYPRMSRAFYVSLRVGHREFIGDGPTRQAARHNAAIKALRILKNMPLQEGGGGKGEGGTQGQGGAADGKVDDSLKSEISLVHEIALRRNMTVTFEVVRETGPPHMKTFVTRCSVADTHTEGEGNSKKSSKKTAAELMLEELKKLPPLTDNVVPRPKVKLAINKKKTRNLIKTELQQQKADPNYGVGINPISRLIQIMQAQKKKEPVYTLVTERGLPRRREFVVQVEVEDQTCVGSGPNKKLAKRCGAEAMLQLLGYTRPSPQPAKSSIKRGDHGEGGTDKKVTFVETEHKAKEQRVPGLLHLPGSKAPPQAPQAPQASQAPQAPPQASPQAPQASPQASQAPQAQSSPAASNGGSVAALPVTTAAATTAKQAPPAPSSVPAANPAPPSAPAVNLAAILKPNLRPEIQLRDLCKALDTSIEVDDFTKKQVGGTEHMTRITVGGSPSQAFHGSSASLESARDAAALDALKVLVARVKDKGPSGDGPQVKVEPVTVSQ